MMAAAESTPLDRAQESIRDAMAVVCDYVKVAAESQSADRFAPAVELMRLLADSLDCVQALREGRGRRAFHSGGVDAE